MKLTLEALQILDTIDRKGSFAAAAIELDRVPSALTYTVRKLEEDLDVLLFDRRGHRARLTEAGRELLHQGRRLIEAAEEIERRVKRIATGREVELKIVIDSLIPFERMIPLIELFDRENTGTRLRFLQETMYGVWDALESGRADLAIGGIGDVFSHRSNPLLKKTELPLVKWVFVVAPEHPLATADEPIASEILARHRAIAVGDTGTNALSPQLGLVCGQDSLTVPTMRDKLNLQLAGVGCGYLPINLAAPYIKRGKLIRKETAEARTGTRFLVAWRAPVAGKSLEWFVDILSRPEIQENLLGETPLAASATPVQPPAASASSGLSDIASTGKFLHA